MVDDDKGWAFAAITILIAWILWIYLQPPSRSLCDNDGQKDDDEEDKVEVSTPHIHMYLAREGATCLRRINRMVDEPSSNRTS